MSFSDSLKKYLKSILSIKFIPRWMVFIFDILIVLFSYVFVTFMLDGMGISINNNKISHLTLYTGLNIFSFWFFKVYSGIIRHSTIIDTAKIFYSQALSFSVLLTINYFCEYIQQDKMFLSTQLFLSALNSLICLIVYRLMIKFVYEIARKNSIEQNKIQILILGVDEKAIATAAAIQGDISSKYSVKGFIDKDSKKSLKRILGLPVYGSNKKPSVIARKLKVSAIILADSSLTKEEKIDVVNSCLEYNLKVLYLPKITDYTNSKNIISNIKNIKIQDLLERKEIRIANDKISKDLQNQVILVTGAAGSIGSEISFQVLGFQPKVLILLDQAETPMHNMSLELEKIKGSTEIICVITDVRKYDDLERVFSKYHPNMVYHAAAYKHVPLMEKNPSQAIYTNVLGSKNLADLSIKFGVSRFVMVSTDKAVNPSNVMGASKRIAEKYVQYLANHKQKEHTTRFITTRFGNVLGSNGSVVPLFTKQIEEGGPITITHPDIIRYFMTIPEACQLVLEAGSMGNGGEIYIFDMGKAVKIIDLALKMIRLAGLKPYEDIDIKVVGLRPGEKLYEELLYDTATTLPTYHEKIMIANDKLTDIDDLESNIEKLIIFANKNLDFEVVRQMKLIAPEFVSLNSEYSVLDKN